MILLTDDHFPCSKFAGEKYVIAQMDGLAYDALNRDRLYAALRINIAERLSSVVLQEIYEMDR